MADTPIADIPVDAVEIKCMLSETPLEPAMTSFVNIHPEVDHW